MPSSPDPLKTTLEEGLLLDSTWPGGCDNIMELRDKGQLKPLLQEAAFSLDPPAR